MRTSDDSGRRRDAASNWLGRFRVSLSSAAIISGVLATSLGVRPLDAKEAPAPDQEEEVDHVALAAKLFRDGHFDRAQLILDQADPKRPGLDLPRFHTLRGLVALEQKRYEPARQSFEGAIAAGQREPVVYLYLAQANFGLEDHKKVLSSLRRAGATGRSVAGAFLMRARAHWELHEPDLALIALDEGKKAFPGEQEFAKIKLFYLIDLGLFQEVARVGKAYLDRKEATADDYAAVGEGLRRSKQLTKAREFLESAHLRFPGDERLLVLLAHTYLDDDRPLIAAMLFEDAARLNPKYVLEAAELYLRAERHERALALNARVADQAAKMKQRLGIFLKLDRYEMITAMAPRLARLGLLEDENVRYALAYGYFKTGAFEQAEGELRHIRDSRLFESAVQLRRAMETCRKAGWECS